MGFPRSDHLHIKVFLESKQYKKRSVLMCVHIPSIPPKKVKAGCPHCVFICSHDDVVSKLNM